MAKSISTNPSISTTDDVIRNFVRRMTSSCMSTYHVYDAIYFFFELYLEELDVLVLRLDLTHHRMYHREIPFFQGQKCHF